MFVNFKYKKRNSPLFNNQFSPGNLNNPKNLATGEDGSVGSVGRETPSMYFINFEPNNDYIKDLLLNKIDNNIILSSDKGTKLPGGKVYGIGDIILTSQYYLYRIKNAPENSKYKFDIEFIGEIKMDNTKLSEEEVLENMIGNINIQINENEDSFLRHGLTVCTRSMDASLGYSRAKLYLDASLWPTGYAGDTSIYMGDISGAAALYSSEETGAVPDLPFNKADDTLITLQVQPSIGIDSSYSSQSENYDFYLRIYLKNEKITNAQTFSVQDMRPSNLPDTTDVSPYEPMGCSSFSFYKYMELPLSKAVQGGTFPEKYYYITDMACDKLHPSGNNIVSYAMDVENPPAVMPLYLPQLNDDFPRAFYKFSNLSMFKESGSAINGKYVFTITAGSAYLNFINNKPKPFNYDRILLYKAFKYKYTNYPDSKGLVKYAIRYLEGTNGIKYSVPNFRGGESAYFSGMVCPGYYTYTDSSGEFQQFFYNNACALYAETRYSVGRYDYYVTAVKSLNRNLSYAEDSSLHPNWFVVDGTIAASGSDEQKLKCDEYTTKRLKITARMVRDEMKNFIFSNDNLYELICVNKTTGRVLNKIVNINLISTP